jgi:hypothetical protein
VKGWGVLNRLTVSFKDEILRTRRVKLGFIKVGNLLTYLVTVLLKKVPKPWNDRSIETLFYECHYYKRHDTIVFHREVGKLQRCRI